MGGTVLSSGLLSAGALAGGSLMGGGKGGGGGGQVQSNPMLDAAIAQQMAYAQKYDQQTDPFRQGFMSDYGQLRSENFDPTNLPGYKQAFGLQKQSLETQYQNAKRNIMGSVAPGGNLAGSLSNLEANRASTMGALPAQTALPIIQDVQNKAYTAGWNMPATVLGGNSSAVNALVNQQASQLGAETSRYGMDQSIYNTALAGIGQGIGKGIGRATRSGK